MSMAGIGALLAMIIIALINLRYQDGFWKEMKASFKIDVGDTPLGEQRLREMRSSGNRPN
jgi:putative membrane protein